MRYAFVLILVAGALQSVAQQIIYVNKWATAPGNGTTWETAFPDLQQALTVAAGTSGQKEIWVARGEYIPTQGLDRTATFNIPSQTLLFGGFIGNEPNKETRDWRSNRTVLSGDLGVQFDYADNSYHVVTARNSDNTSGLDGFIVKYGNANGTAGSSHYNSGGGLLIVNTSSFTGPVINHCEFYENYAVLYGGGVVTISDGAAVAAQITNSYFFGNQSATGAGTANHKVTGNNTTSYINCVFSTNHASGNGGGMSNTGADVSVINCTFSKNNSVSDGGAIYNSATTTTSIKNSILWKNFKGTVESSSVYNQIHNSSATPVVKNSIVQGGYGSSADKNINADPRFETDPSFEGKYPRTSAIQAGWADRKYENFLRFDGTPLPSAWPYYTYKDHTYNKLYLVGETLQIIELSNLNASNIPISSLYYSFPFNFGKTQRIERSIHTETNRIYFAEHYNRGLYHVNRATGVMTAADPMAGEPETSLVTQLYDLVVDDVNNLLYAAVFYYNSSAVFSFYGMLELDLSTGTKRWITETSSPVALSTVPLLDPGENWGIWRLYLDEPNNTLYFSTGAGVWWWNRSTNATGLINTAGGISLASGSPNLPSNITTGMFMDNVENKFYIGTHAGLFVWNRNDNTSRVYDTSNTALTDNIINTISKDDTRNLIHVASEWGGFLTINTVTGEQRYYAQDQGHETHPQILGTSISSSYYDSVDEKLYVSINSPGGVWIWDYKNLVPDYGNLRLGDGSPAIDQGDPAAVPSGIVTDINGNSRFVDYASIQADNSLDLGAHEKTFTCQPPQGSFAFEKTNHTVVFSSTIQNPESGCNFTYNWDFGDGQTSSEANPTHVYATPGTYEVSMEIDVTCGSCPPAQITDESSVVIETSLCGSIFCDPTGKVSIGTPFPAVGYKLSVSGKIIAEGAKVVMQSKWPDYVFSTGYELMTFAALKEYIEKNHHLPGFPDANTVSREGIDVGEMSTLLLKKTEELTLYLLQLDDRLKKIERETK
jgi:PKD repeat protein